MDAEDQDFLILLVYLEDPTKWTEKSLQSSIIQVINLVNSCSDITGIVSAGLMVDKWGDDPLISFLVQHDRRWDSPEEADDMIVRTFSKAIELCKLEQEMWVLEYEHREMLDAD